MNLYNVCLKSEPRTIQFNHTAMIAAEKHTLMQIIAQNLCRTLLIVMFQLAQTKDVLAMQLYGFGTLNTLFPCH